MKFLIGGVLGTESVSPPRSGFASVHKRTSVPSQDLWGLFHFASVRQSVQAYGWGNSCGVIKSIVSTWCYDTPPAGEWAGLARFLETDKSWLDYIMADSHTDFPRFPLDQGVPGGLPLVNFPEISMYGRTPWGGYGANPLLPAWLACGSRPKANSPGGCRILRVFTRT